MLIGCMFVICEFLRCSASMLDANNAWRISCGLTAIANLVSTFLSCTALILTYP